MPETIAERFTCGFPDDSVVRISSKLVTACEKCGTKRLNHTWSKLDFVSMSKKTGVIGKLIVPGYYWSLRHAHATVGALLSRLEDSEVEGISFAPTAQRKEADDALMTAQNVIVDVLNVQDERFKIPGLNEQIQRIIEDFMEMYGKPPKELNMTFRRIPSIPDRF